MSWHKKRKKDFLQDRSNLWLLDVSTPGLRITNDKIFKLRLLIFYRFKKVYHSPPSACQFFCPNFVFQIFFVMDRWIDLNKCVYSSWWTKYQVRHSLLLQFAINFANYHSYKLKTENPNFLDPVCQNVESGCFTSDLGCFRQK